MAPFGVTIPTIPTGLTGLAQPQASTAKAAPKVAAWKAALKPASFRGVPFFVDSDERETGRRAATHEFPGRDMPYTEDLGRKARTITVEGYVLGADYMQRRDALLAACEAEGPAPLIVPWMPEIRVVCTACRKHETVAEGGMARFSLTFAEAGQAVAPTVAPLPGVQAGQKADDALKAAGRVLDSSITIAGVPLPVSEATLSTIRSLGGVLSGASSITRLAADLPGGLKMLANLTASDFMRLLPSELCGPLFSLAGAYTSLQAAYGPAHAQRAASLLAIAQATPTVQAPAGAGLVRSTIAANQAAVYEYQRTAAVAEAARSATLSAPASRQEAAALRAEVVAGIDTVLDASRDEGVYTAFTELRTQVVQTLAEAAGSAPELTTVRTGALLPSLALAQQLAPGADATEQEAQLLARNPVRHPGFVPPGDLEVLRAL
ncbi:MAG: DNA circularization N-terminal domain-containing protein [Proteobacteria bacterium]|nr:DNA circularization N-terminal domain-containing protein [Pseudomonadota bacterium]MBU1594268.1 DNA circularization N-terminal domain-containing protein [Pseudomonadota bacterium]